MFDRFKHERPMIGGLCAWMADRSGFPVWIIRAGALLLLFTHGPLALLGYLAGAYALRRERRAAGWHAPACVPDKFADLDRRMAEVEMAAWREDFRRR